MESGTLSTLKYKVIKNMPLALLLYFFWGRSIYVVSFVFYGFENYFYRPNQN